MASFLKHFRTLSALTLVSRLAGLARDAALAHFVGAGAIMDAYSMAFRLPNLLRQLLGEGALTAAFVPVFTEYLEKGGPKAANRFMSLMVVALVTVLAAVTLIADGLLLALRYLTDAASKWHLIFGLAAVLLPFGIMVCLVALLQAALNCQRHFVMPALAPVVLNLFIIAGSVAAGLWVADDPVRQVYLISATILAAGVVEIAIQVPAMRRAGLEFRPVWDLRDPGLRRVIALVGPMALAIGLVQVNVFLDSLLANLLSPPQEGTGAFVLAGRQIPYPMKIGAASVLYYGPLIYQFPLGVFAIALATVIFPVLSHHAVRRDFAGLGQTASHGLRLTLFIGIPAGVGIILVCRPLIELYLGHGQFARYPDAVTRTATVASLFSLGLWAYSANHIFVRAFYALEDVRTPLGVALASAGLNLALNLLLIWPLAEAGMAVATVVAAVFKLAVLAHLLSRRCEHFRWGQIGSTAARTVVASAAMAAAAAAAMWLAGTALPEGSRQQSAARLVSGVAVGAAAFLAAARLMRMPELADLLGSRLSAATGDATSPAGAARRCDRPADLPPAQPLDHN